MTLAYLLPDHSQGPERGGHGVGQGHGYREGQRAMDPREEGEVELSPEGEEPSLDRAPVDDQDSDDSDVEDDEFADISFQHYVVITHPPGTLPLIFIPFTFSFISSSSFPSVPKSRGQNGSLTPTRHRKDRQELGEEDVPSGLSDQPPSRPLPPHRSVPLLLLSIFLFLFLS